MKGFSLDQKLLEKEIQLLRCSQILPLKTYFPVTLHIHFLEKSGETGGMTIKQKKC